MLEIELKWMLQWTFLLGEWHRTVHKFPDPQRFLRATLRSITSAAGMEDPDYGVNVTLYNSMGGVTDNKYSLDGDTDF